MSAAAKPAAKAVAVAQPVAAGEPGATPAQPAIQPGPPRSRAGPSGAPPAPRPAPQPSVPHPGVRSQRPPRPSRSAEPGAHRPGLVTIVVPAKDEADAVGKTLRSLPLATLKAAGFDTEVIVLDGHSTDGTREIAHSLGATVIRDREPGKGAALRHARELFRGEYVVMLDADGTYAADAIPRLLGPLAWGEADIAMGRRRALPSSMSGTHKVGNVLLSFGASVLYGRACPDVCTGLWAFKADALRRLPLRSKGFELEAELFALASRLGLRIAHVPVDYLPRQGRTKLSGARDGIRIGWWLLRSRFVSLRAPEVAA